MTEKTRYATRTVTWELVTFAEGIGERRFRYETSDEAYRAAALFRLAFADSGLEDQPGRMRADVRPVVKLRTV